MIHNALHPQSWSCEYGRVIRPSSWSRKCGIEAATLRHAQGFARSERIGARYGLRRCASVVKFLDARNHAVLISTARS